MKKEYVILFSLLLLCSCQTFNTIRKISVTMIMPTEGFHTQIPFLIDSTRSLFIATTWNNNTKPYYLKIDNHAPTAVDSYYIHTDKLRYVGAVSIPKRTPEGKKFKQKYYSLDNMHIGNLELKNVSFLQLPYNYAALRKHYIGLLGNNILSHCVVMIDFRDSTLHLASHIDSLNTDPESLVPMNTRFFLSRITFPKFHINKKSKKMQLDLGYNGDLLLKHSDFRDIDKNNTAKIKKGKAITVMGTESATYKLLDSASVKSGSLQTTTSVLNNSIVEKNLVGLNFFSMFDFVIIDYPGKKLYVSRQ